MKEKATKKSSSPSADEGSGVDAIREVLLGDRLRMYEEWFDLLDRTVQSEREALRDTFEQKLTNMQAAVKERLDHLVASVGAEEKARTEAISSVVLNLDKASQQLRDQIDGLRTEHQAFKQESQRESLALSKNLFKELQDSAAMLSSLVDRESSRLGSVKVDRGEMAQALNQMANVIADPGDKPAS